MIGTFNNSTGVITAIFPATAVATVPNSIIEIHSGITMTLEDSVTILYDSANGNGACYILVNNRFFNYSLEFLWN